MDITLKPAAIDEAEAWHAMQVKVYSARLEKRQGYDVDPAAETAKQARERFTPCREHFWILLDGKTVGAIRTAWRSDEPGRYWLEMMMILPEHQNRGIGQEAVRLLEARYPEAQTWELATLLQDERNLRFFEKLGYRRVGEPQVVNERLSLVEHKKWVDPVLNYYGQGREDGRFEARHTQVEYLTTMRYIERYLAPAARIIEIGAGTGRYSLSLADMGYAVDAVELSETNIKTFCAKIKPEHNIALKQGNALDLSGYADDTYDITLLLGPLYHLFTPARKRRAIAEALRVTKPGGIVFAAYCISDVSILTNGFCRKAFDVAQYIEKGKIDPVTFAVSSVSEDVFELVRKEDIDELMQGFSIERLHYVGADVLARCIAPQLAEMSGEDFALYLKYHYAVCERPDLVGAAAHALDIFRKAEKPLITIIPYDSRYRDDMLYCFLAAKEALGEYAPNKAVAKPRLKEDLLNIEGTYLNRGDAFYLAIDKNDRVVGMVGTETVSPADLWLKRLFVKPELKGRGIGGRLLAEVEKRALGKGITTIHTRFANWHKEAARFYPAKGFVDAGHDELFVKMAKRIGEETT